MDMMMIVLLFLLLFFLSRISLFFSSSRNAARVLVALGNGLIDGSGAVGALSVMASVPFRSAAAAEAAAAEAAADANSSGAPDDAAGDSAAVVHAATEPSTAVTADVPHPGKAEKEGEATTAATITTVGATPEANPEAAREAFQRAVDLLPDHVGALHGLGAAHWVLGEPRAADGAWSQAVGAYDADAARVRFICYSAKQFWKEVESCMLSFLCAYLRFLEHSSFEPAIRAY